MSLAGFLLLPFVSNPYFRQYIFSVGIGWVLTLITMVIFFLVDDLRRGTFWTVGQVVSATGAKFMNTEKGIPRSTFLSWLGVGLSSTLFFSLLYGFGNKYNYKLIRKKLVLAGLPLAFKGFKIIHISDIHSGSLQDKEAVLKGIKMIQSQHPDLVLFTGDLVNDKATEMRAWMDVFNQIKAPHGVYSTLGNHDYGDYVQWPSAEAKHQNLEDLKQVHAQLGWKLMMNENTKIEIDGQTLDIFHTPGHSPGSICIYSKSNSFIISGDVLFNGSIGRTDLPGGDFDTLSNSIKTKLYLLPNNTRVFSGHGESTLIGNEKINNPFVTA
jgi:predicted phosphodiesterase